MDVKFSQDVIPVTTLKENPAKVIQHVSEAHRPVLLTSRGHGVAVVQSLEDYELKEEERKFMKAIIEGLRDIEEGRVVGFSEVKAKFKLK
jgi:prevent-host-death family protein